MAGEVVGQAWWEFQGDDSKLRAEVTKTEADIKASAARGGTAFSGAMQSATGKVKGYFGDLANVAKGFVAIFAAQQVVSFLGDAVGQAREETASVAQLTASLEANSAAFDGNNEAIEKVIEERMALGFADDEQRSSLAGLTAITKDHNKALDLQRTAMDLARLRGIDLRTATDILGKVYGGNIGILARYGIQLQKGATSTEALAAIQKMAAGQAESFADSEAGAGESTAIAFSELTESVGKLLLPALTELAKFARDVVVPALRFLVDAVGLLFGPIGLVFDVITAGIDIAGDAVTNFAMDFGEQGDKIHGLADRIGTDFDDIKDRVQRRMAETGETFDQAFAAIEESATTSMTQVHNAVATNMGGVLSTIQANAEPIEREYERIASMPTAAMEAEYQSIRDAAYQSMVEHAKGLMDGQNLPQVAFDAAMQMVEDEMTEAEEVAALKGKLLTLQHAAGIAAQEGKDASVVAINEAIKVVTDRLDALGASAYTYGFNTADAFASGLNAGYGYVVDAAGNLAAAARGQIGIESEPRDPSSPLRGITKWGGNAARTWADSALAEVASIRSAAGMLAAAAADGLRGQWAGGILASSMAATAAVSAGGAMRGPEPVTTPGGGAGETHLHAHLEVTGRPDVVDTEADLARLFGRVVGIGFPAVSGG